MKRHLAIIVAGLVLSACAPGMYHTHTGAAIGGGLGALMGQAIGHSAESTLVGAGVGTLIGAALGSYEDRRFNDVEVHQTGDSQVVYVHPAPTVNIVTRPHRVTPRGLGGYRPPPPRPNIVALPPVIVPRTVHRPPPPGARYAPPRFAPRPDPDRHRTPVSSPGPPQPRLDERRPPSLSLNPPGRSHGDLLHEGRPRGETPRMPKDHPPHGERFRKQQ